MLGVLGNLQCWQNVGLIINHPDHHKGRAWLRMTTQREWNQEMERDSVLMTQVKILKFIWAFSSLNVFSLNRILCAKMLMLEFHQWFLHSICKEKLLNKAGNPSICQELHNVVASLSKPANQKLVLWDTSQNLQSLFSVDVYYILLPCDCILIVCGYLATPAVFTSTALGGGALTAGLDAHDFVFCCCCLPNVSSH